MTHSNSYSYNKIQMIGSGGTAVVYLATVLKDGQETDEQVALKLINKKASADPTFRARLEREIEMLKKVSHPHILPILDHGEVDGQVYIAMPYVSGGTVRDRLEDGAIPWETTIGILEQICPALDEMHSLGFIHRDLKPHNILVSEEGVAFLSDFGISRPIEVSKEDSVTHTLDIVGTPEFIAPEQAAHGELTPQTDIYQLGVTVFYMLTGQKLFNGSALQIIAKHLGEAPGSAVELDDSLPKNLDAVLHMALAKDPEDRFKTADDFLDALKLMGDQNTVTFRHLPGLPLREGRSAPVLPPADYEAVVPAAAAPSAAHVAASVSGIIPSASSSGGSPSTGRPWLRYMVVTLMLLGLIGGGAFIGPDLIDEISGNGNGGGNNNGNGGGRGNGNNSGNGGGRGNGNNGGGNGQADDGQAVVETGDILEDIVATFGIGNGAETETPALATEIPQEAVEAQEPIEIVEAVVEAAPELVSVVVEARTDSPVVQIQPNEVPVQDEVPLPIEEDLSAYPGPGDDDQDGNRGDRNDGGRRDRGQADSRDGNSDNNNDDNGDGRGDRQQNDDGDRNRRGDGQGRSNGNGRNGGRGN